MKRMKLRNVTAGVTVLALTSCLGIRKQCAGTNARASHENDNASPGQLRQKATVKRHGTGD